MTRQLAGCLLLGMLMFASGCAVCASPFDYDYSAYGGSWERGDPSQGRVGSAFLPAGVTVQSPDGSVPAEWMPSQEADESESGDRSILAPSQSMPESANDDDPPAPDSLLLQ